jgi:hypothetical protein
MGVVEEYERMARDYNAQAARADRCATALRSLGVPCKNGGPDPVAFNKVYRGISTERDESARRAVLTAGQAADQARRAATDALRELAEEKARDDSRKQQLRRTVGQLAKKDRRIARLEAKLAGERAKRKAPVPPPEFLDPAVKVVKGCRE